MSSSTIDVFMPIVILMALSIAVVLGGFLVSSILSPSDPSARKSSPYECGEEPVGDAWALFNVRFYVVGLIFIIFDVESALMFPVVSVFKSLNAQGKGGIVLFEILLFLFILVTGIAYCWRKGDLDWVKSFSTDQKGQNRGR